MRESVRETESEENEMEKEKKEQKGGKNRRPGKFQ